MKKLLALTGALLLLYLATYAAMLKPIDAMEGNLGRFARFNVPAYRAGGPWAVVFFRPLNRVDQVIRPLYWAEHEILDADFVIDRIEEVAIPEPVDPDTPLPN